MANRIKGITIEIGGDTTKLSKALSDVNKTIQNTQSQLKDVNKLLKLDPGNTELIAQKQRLLGDSIKATTEKLDKLKEAQKQAQQALKDGTINQEQYDALQREIVQTEQDLQNLEDEYKKCGKSAEDMGETSKKGAEVAKKAIQGIAVVASAVAGVVAKVVKDAVQSYAEYEQLVGGVETLFKQSADTVQKYAQDAYKTAGLSANEYMDTVTSFSASLISSLGGDTKKSAEIGNQAIIDMSDNANKMGTDMQLLQNAYQGFAKGQFNMLDNLKLGYGGNKTEMERLLKDAQKLSGVKYNIDSFADISQAIHVIQENLDIAGTTQKEAMSTIQGSAQMTKSAWQNVLTSLASGEGNIQQMVGNLITSAQALLNNLIPVIKEALKGIVTAIGQIAPEIIQILPGLATDIIPPMLSAIELIMVALMDVMPDLVTTIIETLLNHIDELIECAVTMFTALVDGLSTSIPQLIPVMLQAVVTIVNALINNMPKLLQASGKLIGALVSGLIKNLPQIASAGTQILNKLKGALSISNLVKWGKDMIQGIINGIKSMLPSVGATAQSVASKISSFLHFSRPDVGPLRDYETWMPDFIGGMVKGIKNNQYKLADATQDLATSMVVTPNTSLYNAIGNLNTTLNKGNVIVLDSGELIGATVKGYNGALGNVARMEMAR